VVHRLRLRDDAPRDALAARLTQRRTQQVSVRNCYLAM